MRTAVHNQKAARRKAMPAEEQAAEAAARAEKAAELKKHKVRPDSLCPSPALSPGLLCIVE